MHSDSCVWVHIHMVLVCTNYYAIHQIAVDLVSRAESKWSVLWCCQDTSNTMLYIIKIHKKLNHQYDTFWQVIWTYSYEYWTNKILNIYYTISLLEHCSESATAQPMLFNYWDTVMEICLKVFWCNNLFPSNCGTSFN